jgi:predicted component of type VI protein secretion system
MIFENEIGQKIINPTKEQLEDMLDQLEGVSNSYAYLEAENDDYIQVGGGPIEFTVEIRENFNNGEFKQWKAQLRDSDDEGTRFVIIAGSEVKVCSNQILNIKTVKELFGLYLEGNRLPEIINWSDITDMFL